MGKDILHGVGNGGHCGCETVSREVLQQVEIPEKWTQEPPCFAITIGARLRSHTNETLNFVPIALLLTHTRRCIANANAKIAVCYLNVFAYKGFLHVSVAMWPVCLYLQAIHQLQFGTCHTDWGLFGKAG